MVTLTSEHPPQQAPRLPTAAAAIALLRNSLARTHPPDRSPPSPTAHAHNCSSRCGKNRQTPSFLQDDSDCTCTLRLACTDATMDGWRQVFFSGLDVRTSSRTPPACSCSGGSRAHALARPGYHDAARRGDTAALSPPCTNREHCRVSSSSRAVRGLSCRLKAITTYETLKPKSSACLDSPVPRARAHTASRGHRRAVTPAPAVACCCPVLDTSGTAQPRTSSRHQI